MERILHLKVVCPQCGKHTSIYAVVGSVNPKVKCEHCKTIFVFGRSIMYDPVGYVQSIPSWVRITGTDEEKEFSQTVQCKQCGKRYNTVDTDVDADAVNKNSITSSGQFQLGLRKVFGLTLLLKCSRCSAIACSSCALESDGIIKMRCPFCKADYTSYSYIRPTAENASKEARHAYKKSQTDDATSTPYHLEDPNDYSPTAENASKEASAYKQPQTDNATSTPRLLEGTNDYSWKCSVCGCEQRKNRTICFKCGVVFESIMQEE